MTLEQNLDWCAKFGRPRLMMMDSGKWVAKVEVFVIGEGVSMDIKSDFDNETPLAAVDQLRERIVAALLQMQLRAKDLGLVTP